MMKKIKVFTKNGCPQCDMTKRVLMAEQIEFEAINVEENEEAMHYVKEVLGFSAMPVVEVKGETPFTGFRPDKLQALKG